MEDCVEVHEEFGVLSEGPLVQRPPRLPKGREYLPGDGDEKSRWTPIPSPELPNTPDDPPGLRSVS